MKISEVMSRKNLNYKDVTKRIPELTIAAEKLANGEISAHEYNQLVNQYKPVEPYDPQDLPEPASYDDMHNALHTSKRNKLNAPIQDGEMVKLRLDIPAYKEHGVWVPTVHGKSGTVIAHNSTSIINNVTMILPQKGALNIARGKSDKAPIATLQGEWENATPNEAKEQAKIAMHDQNWIQIGMDPERHAYFYDRKTLEPVVAGDRAIQIGPLVLLKNPTYGNKQDYIYEN